MSNETKAASALIAGIHKRPGQSIRFTPETISKIVKAADEAPASVSRSGVRTQAIHGAPVADDASPVAKTVASIHAKPNFAGVHIDGPTLRMAVLKAALGVPYASTEAAKAALEKGLGYVPTLDEPAPAIRKTEPTTTAPIRKFAKSDAPVLTVAKIRAGITQFGKAEMLKFARMLERGAARELGWSDAQAKEAAMLIRDQLAAA